jgi:hypothetical protein
LKRPLLTVLTTPIAGAPRRAYQRVRRSVRPLFRPGVPLPAASPYPGHFALVRSVVDGLRAIGADFNFNPRSFGEVGTVVYAPANEALRQAAALKRDGRIDRLVAGPVNALFPTESECVLMLPEIDRLIVASEWVIDLYRAEAPQLVPKIRVCPAGVDTDAWRPRAGAIRNTGLVYWKSGSETFCEEVERVVKRCGVAPVRIRCGDYTREEFRRALDSAAVAVFLSSFETQGLALAEAWAMDVPTVVWDPRADTEWRGRRFRSGSSCPWLTPETGRTFGTPAELESVLIGAVRAAAAFHPRQWVLAHMTDAVCAAQLHHIILDGLDGFDGPDRRPAAGI